MKHYKWDLVITFVVFAIIAAVYGLLAIVPLAILVILEISFSFDNAVVNAKVLAKMSPRWQTAFMTVGIMVAVFGMRFVFPILIVSLTAGLGFGEVISLALSNPHLYADKLEAAHGEIAMLGGVFLTMIFLNFIFEEKEVMWLEPIEKKLAKVGKIDTVSAMITLILVIVISSNAGDDGGKLLMAGVISLALYLGVNALSMVFDNEDDNASGALKTGLAGLGMFLYLEAQDAAFSFDGVSGAFAITDKVVLIAAGLGIGALFVRSMTVHLLRTGKLAEFRYLEHGAHWAIGVLASCILASIFIEISNYITGCIGVIFIVISLWSSIRANKHDAALDIGPEK